MNQLFADVLDDHEDFHGFVHNLPNKTGPLALMIVGGCALLIYVVMAVLEYKLFDVKAAAAQAPSRTSSASGAPASWVQVAFSGVHVMAKMVLFLCFTALACGMFTATFWYYMETGYFDFAGVLGGMVLVLLSLTPAKGAFKRVLAQICAVGVIMCLFIAFGRFVAEYIDCQERCGLTDHVYLPTSSEIQDGCTCSKTFAALAYASFCALTVFPLVYDYIANATFKLYELHLRRAFLNTMPSHTLTMGRCRELTLSHGMPIWLAGVTINDFKRLGADAETYGTYQLSSIYSGSERTGFFATPRSRNASETVAMSGAAVSMLCGRMDDAASPLRFASGLFNLGISHFDAFPPHYGSESAAWSLIPSLPFFAASALVWLTLISYEYVWIGFGVLGLLAFGSAFPFARFMAALSFSDLFRTVRLMLGMPFAGVAPPTVLLSDGGHFENLGCT